MATPRYYAMKDAGRWLSCTTEYLKAHHKPRIEKHLILDLDECLICNVGTMDGLTSADLKDIRFFSFKTDSQYTKATRPGLYPFLQAMRKHYRIHAFTSATEPYAMHVIDGIDPHRQFFDGNIFTRSNVKLHDGRYYKHLHEVIFNNQFSSVKEAVAHAQKHAILLDDNPFYAIESGDKAVEGDTPINYADNVISVNRFSSLHHEVQFPPLLIHFYRDLLIYLASTNDIGKSMRKLKKMWSKNDVIMDARDLPSFFF